MFEPIFQLQALRYRFLLIRALCRLGASSPKPQAAYFRDAALLAWRASRLIGGWLHGHPNDQYHPASTSAGRVALRSHAALIGLLHWSVRQRTLWLHRQLELVGQACADIRAVTSSVAINDILGRRQSEIAALQRLTGAAAAIAAPAQRPQVAVVSPSGGEEPWPFLSI
jgi:hypothetical protein